MLRCRCWALGCPLVQDVHCVGVCISVVDDDRFAQFGSYLQLLAKNAALHVARRVVAVEIKAYLTDGDYFRVMGQVLQFGQRGVVGSFGIVRVKTDGGKNPFMGFSQCHGCLAGLQVGANGYNSDHAGLPGTGQHRIAISVELVKVQMDVRVDQHYFNPAMRIPSSKMAGTLSLYVVSQ